jgi:glycosyltransferase involved in cell wall biosynthesis
VSGAAFVSVVTPFHNTVDYLEQCMQSVLAQTHGHFEYLLCDNASTDGSSELARAFAARDPRVRYIRYDELLPQMENYNRALEAISGAAQYCKIVQADDWLFPECLEKMVKVAERAPEVGLVTSYFLKGSKPAGGVENPEVEVHSGRDFCRHKLLAGGFPLGSQTAVMYRANLVRSHRPFYPIGRLHADTEVAYRILETHALGFVPQILCFQRIDNPSIRTSIMSFDPIILDRLLEIEMFADRFLTAAEARQARAGIRREYFAFMGRNVLRMRERRFWDYHFRGLRTIGWEPPYFRLARAAASQVLELALNPLEMARRLRRVLSG